GARPSRLDDQQTGELMLRRANDADNAPFVRCRARCFRPANIGLLWRALTPPAGASPSSFARWARFGISASSLYPRTSEREAAGEVPEGAFSARSCASMSARSKAARTAAPGAGTRRRRVHSPLPKRARQE